jgi:hypothetical protein
MAAVSTRRSQKVGQVVETELSLRRQRKKLSFGEYPHVGLKDVRNRRDAARKLLANGVDPLVTRKSAKTTAVNTFEIEAILYFPRILANAKLIILVVEVVGDALVLPARKNRCTAFESIVRLSL